MIDAISFIHKKKHFSWTILEHSIQLEKQIYVFTDCRGVGLGLGTFLIMSDIPWDD